MEDSSAHADRTAPISAIPHIDSSNSRSSSSSHARPRWMGNSEEEFGDFKPGLETRSHGHTTFGSPWQSRLRILQQGAFGHFLFRTSLGRQMYVGRLMVWISCCEFGLVAINRLIFLTGVYKFPYPLTATLIQIFLTHLLMLAFATLTRSSARHLQNLGLEAAVAPSPRHPRSSEVTEARWSRGSIFRRKWPLVGSDGLAGGGVFEFNLGVARQVFPLALIFSAKVALSNSSFAYAALPIYTIARIPALPLSLIITAKIERTPHSGSTLSSSLIAALNLFIASIGPSARVTGESIVTGVISSIFVALYPIMFLRTFRCLTVETLRQSNTLSGHSTSPGYRTAGINEETLAYWRILHYTSILSIMVLFPIVIMTGELGYIYRNCYFLDIPFFWFLTVCGAIGAWGLFMSTPLLYTAAGPLASTFLIIPGSAFQLVTLSHSRLPVQSWVAVILCWLSSAWFLLIQQAEGRFGKNQEFWAAERAR